MAFKDLSSCEKKTQGPKDCKDQCVSTEFSKELTPKTAVKDEDCKDCKDC